VKATVGCSGVWHGRTHTGDVEFEQLLKHGDRLVVEGEQMRTRTLTVVALCVGGTGVVLGFWGLIDSCLPGTWSRTPGWSCYSPPWAWPALALGAVLVTLALIGLMVAGLAHLRRVTRRAGTHPR
jgi:hypothetical protein